MRYLIVFIFLSTSTSLFSQVRPDFAPIEENPDTSNFEVYGQKDGNLRRAKLDAIGDYILENYVMVYDSVENRIRVTAFGQAVDTLSLTGSSGVTVTLTGDDLTIGGTTIDLSDYDGSLSYNSSTYTISHTDGGVTENVSLAALVRDLSYNSSNYYLSLGTDSVDLSTLRQTLSYNSSTNVLSLSNSGGSVTLDGTDGLTEVTSESYFGGNGTSGDPLSIDDDGITFSKIQNIPSNSLIGRYSSGIGNPESINIGADFIVTGAGTLELSGSGDEFRTFKDTTVYSSGGDLTSSDMAALIQSYDEVRIDVVVESGASSNFIINLPIASSDTLYKDKTLVFYVTDESSSYACQLNNVENVSGEIYTFDNGGAVNIKSVQESGTRQWILVGSNEANLSLKKGFFEVDSLNVVGIENNISISSNSSGDPILVTLTVNNPSDISSANIIVNTTKDFTIRVTDSSGETNNDVSDLWLPTINVYDISSVDLSGTTGDNVSHNNTDYIPSSIDWSPSNAVDIQFSGGDYSSKSKLLIILTW